MPEDEISIPMFAGIRPRKCACEPTRICRWCQKVAPAKVPWNVAVASHNGQAERRGTDDQES